MTYKYKDPNAVNQMVQQEFTAYYALVDLFSVEEAQSCMQHAAEAGGYFNVHGVSTVLYYSQITAEDNVAQSSSRRRRQRERERRTDAVLSDTSSMPMPRSAMPTASPRLPLWSFQRAFMPRFMSDLAAPTAIALRPFLLTFIVSYRPFQQAWPA